MRHSGNWKTKIVQRYETYCLMYASLARRSGCIVDRIFVSFSKLVKREKNTSIRTTVHYRPDVCIIIVYTYVYMNIIVRHPLSHAVCVWNSSKDLWDRVRNVGCAEKVRSLIHFDLHVFWDTLHLRWIRLYSVPLIMKYGIHF